MAWRPPPFWAWSGAHDVHGRAPGDCRAADNWRLLHLRHVPRVPGCAHRSARDDRNADHGSFRRPGAHNEILAEPQEDSEAHERTIWLPSTATSISRRELRLRAGKPVLHGISFSRTGNGDGAGWLVGLGQVDDHRADLRLMCRYEGQVLVDGVDLSTARLNSIAAAWGGAAGDISI